MLHRDPTPEEIEHAKLRVWAAEIRDAAGERAEDAALLCKLLDLHADLFRSLKPRAELLRARRAGGHTAAGRGAVPLALGRLAPLSFGGLDSPKLLRQERSVLGRPHPDRLGGDRRRPLFGGADHREVVRPAARPVPFVLVGVVRVDGLGRPADRVVQEECGRGQVAVERLGQQGVGQHLHGVVGRRVEERGPQFAQAAGEGAPTAGLVALGEAAAELVALGEPPARRLPRRRRRRAVA